MNRRPTVLPPAGTAERLCVCILASFLTWIPCEAQVDGTTGGNTTHISIPNNTVDQVSFEKPLLGAAIPQQARTKVAVPNDFRITIENSQVRDGKRDSNEASDQIAAKHLVLFTGGQIYGFSLLEPREITVIDPQENQLHLISLSSQTRCTLPMDALMAQTSRLKDEIQNPKDRLRLGLDAKVEVSQEGMHRIRYGQFEYQTSVQRAESQWAAVEFAKFADWASRLNVVRNLGAPPFARMKLNESIAAAGCFPRELYLTYRQGDLMEKYRSNYHWRAGLSTADKKRIADVSGMLTTYRQVKPQDFR